MLEYRAEGLCRNANHLNKEELDRCIGTGEILQSTALAYDTERRLRFELCGQRAYMPYEECLDVSPGETIKDIAVLTRVGRPTCFVITGTAREPNEMCIRDRVQTRGVNVGDVQMEAFFQRFRADGRRQNALFAVDGVDFVAGVQFFAGNKGLVTGFQQQLLAVGGRFPLGLAVVEEGLVSFAEILGGGQRIGGSVRYGIILVQQLLEFFCSLHV